MEELLVYLLGLLFQAAVEGLADLASRRVTFRDDFVVYIYFGAFAAVLGFASKLLFPAPSISVPELRYLNLFLMPVAIGYGMHRLGTWLESKGRRRGWLEFFGRGAFFAFCFEAARIVATR
jgi:hypothetical protein